MFYMTEEFATTTPTPPPPRSEGMVKIDSILPTSKVLWQRPSALGALGEVLQTGMAPLCSQRRYKAGKDPIPSTLPPGLQCPFQTYFPDDEPIGMPGPFLPVRRPAWPCPWPPRLSRGGRLSQKGRPQVHQASAFQSTPSWASSRGTAPKLWFELPGTGKFGVRASLLPTWRPQA